VESAGMKNLMMDMKPQRYENIVAAISLYRPGPLEYIPTYNKRLHGEEPVKYHHADLEGALGETYGILVYQEQIMRVARDFAGYSMGQADTIRKAVSKKNAEDLAKHKSKFRDGAVANGYPAEVAEAIWADIEFFARYGFNKSHAAIYASMTCQTAWLKANYAIEYMTALLTAEAGDSEKIALLISDCRKRGIEVLPPDVNASELGFSIDDHVGKRGAIRFGLMAIKNVGEGPIGTLLAARNDGPFKNIDDFARRVDMGQINKRALESLIKAGAMDAFGPRHQLLEALDRIAGATAVAREAAARGQGMLFGGLDQPDDTPLVTLNPRAPEIPQRELLNAERELIGTYVSSHPLAAALEHLQDRVTRNSSDITIADNGQPVVVAGIVTSVRPHTSKNGKAMGFGMIEDLYGTIELTIFPRTWETYAEMFVKDKTLLIWGKAEAKEGSSPKIIVDKAAASIAVARSADAPAPGSAIDEYDAAPPPEFGADVLGSYLDSIGAGPDMPPDPYEDATRAASASIDAEPVAPPPPTTTTPAFTLKNAAPVAPLPAPTATFTPKTAAPAEPPPVAAPPPPATPPVTPKSAAPAEPPPAPDRTQSPLTVVLQRNGDVRADIARLEAVLSTLKSYPGSQPFSLLLRNNGPRDQIIDFPNDCTRDCQELRTRLQELLGPGCVV
jgi:DNA polymerase-3 subunit alpha